MRNIFIGSMKVAVSAVFVLGVAVISGCGGGGQTDGGGAGSGDTSETPYIPDNLGSLSLQVLDTDMQVSEISGFVARVVDAQGQGIPLTRITCDSEEGVAIVEPTSGSELTDAGGAISGKVGCTNPGSYLFGCRLPVGGNKRKFVTVVCRGPIPTGFGGFPGAGGGGLGGGSSGDDDGGTGGTDTSGITLTGINLFEAGSETISIDTVGGVCGTAPDLTPEPYTDTLIRFTVANNTNQSITFSSYSFSVNGFESGDIPFIGTNIIGSKKSVTLNSILASGAGGNKTFIGASSAIGTPGVLNVTVTLVGENDAGQTVSISGIAVASFLNYNRCES